MKKILRQSLCVCRRVPQTFIKFDFSQYEFKETWSEGLIASHGIASHGNQDTANELNLLCLLFLDAVSDLLQIFFNVVDAMSQKSKLL